MFGGGSNDHTHSLTHVEAASATCTTDGNIEYWYCEDCGKYYSDEDAATEITQAQTVSSATGHTATKTDAVAETCTEDGNIEYWYCSACDKYFSDENCTTEITQSDTVVAAHHNLTHVGAVAETCTTDGNIEYWYCEDCGKYYSDEDAATEITLTNTVVEATGHTSSSGSTSYDAEYHYYTCTECGATGVNAEAHTYDDDDVCTVCGYEKGTSVGLEYTAVYDNDNETIVSYTVSGIGSCADTNLVIPSTYNFAPVTAIAASTFDGKSFTSVYIPNSVTSIGKSAFYNCKSLTGVYYGGTASQWASITFVGNSANPLNYANNLYLNGNLAKEITIEGITKINDESFEGCTSLTSITIGSGVTYIGTNAFANCTSITSVYYCGTADGWSAISKGANNSYLTNATIYYYAGKDSTTTAGNYWYYDTDGTIKTWTVTEEAE